MRYTLLHRQNQLALSCPQNISLKSPGCGIFSEPQKERKEVQTRVATPNNKPLPAQPTGVNMWMTSGERCYVRWLFKEHASRWKPVAHNRSRRFCRQHRTTVYAK